MPFPSIYFVPFFFSHISLGQIGPYSVNNNSDCDIYAQATAFNGDCNSIDCESASGTTGWILVTLGNTVNIASSYSGSGDVWGYIEVYPSGSPGSKIHDGHADCFTQSGSICNSAVVTYECASALVSP